MESKIEKIKITFPCPICSEKNHSFELTMDEIKNCKSFPFSFIFNHDDKMLLIYIDNQNKVRGVEKIDLTQSKLKSKEKEISQLNKVDGMKIKGKIIKDQKLGNVFVQN